MALFGFLAAAAKGLSKAGIVRGSVGKALGYKPPKAVSSLPSGILGQAGAFIMSQPNPVRGPIVGPGGSPFRTRGGIFAGVQSGSSSTAPGYQRRRRMNPTNFRALDRALRRIKGFEKRAKKVLRITRPGAKVGLKVSRK